MAKRVGDLWTKHSGKLGESRYEEGLGYLKTAQELTFYSVPKFSTPYKLRASLDMTTADGSVMAISTHFLLCTLPCWTLPLQSLSLPGGMLQDSASCYFFSEPHDTLIVIEMFDTASLKYVTTKFCIYPSRHRIREWAQKANANVYAIG